MGSHTAASGLIDDSLAAASGLIDNSFTVLLLLEAASFSLIKVPHVDAKTEAVCPLDVYSLITKCYAPDARIVPSYMEKRPIPMPLCGY